MWESPIYKFKAEIDGKLQYIYIDVTGSAPNFKRPGKQLSGTYDRLLKDLIPSETKILDFGAAKLRNTIHLLKLGYTVYACEFEDLFKRSKQASDHLNEANKYKNFKRLLFPEEFIGFDGEFDVILLINVLNIMPVPIERMCVLALCREKVKDDGRLLWYTQHGAYSSSDAVTTLFDGIVPGKKRKFKMFYRDFSRIEIHDMLKSTGFSYNENFKFPMSGSSNQAYVFDPDGPILVDKTLGLTNLIRRDVQRKLKTVEREARWKTKTEETDSKKVVYSSQIPTRITPIKKVNILEAYLKELDKIPTGKKNAYRYHKLIFNILKSVLDNRLRKPKMEENLREKTQRVDITFKNYRERGFFKQLDKGYHIICPNIFIECKNYKKDIANPEFAQIQNRLNKMRGQFGILICRQIDDYEKIKKRQETLVKDDKFVIVLCDSDIKKLVEWKLKGDEEEIDDFLEERYKELT